MTPVLSQTILLFKQSASHSSRGPSWLNRTIKNATGTTIGRDFIKNVEKQQPRTPARGKILLSLRGYMWGRQTRQTPPHDALSH